MSRAIPQSEVVAEDLHRQPADSYLCRVLNISPEPTPGADGYPHSLRTALLQGMQRLREIPETGQT